MLVLWRDSGSSWINHFMQGSYKRQIDVLTCELLYKLGDPTQRPFAFLSLLPLLFYTWIVDLGLSKTKRPKICPRALNSGSIHLTTGLLSTHFYSTMRPLQWLTYALRCSISASPKLRAITGGLEILGQLSGPRIIGFGIFPSRIFPTPLQRGKLGIAVERDKMCCSLYRSW